MSGTTFSLDCHILYLKSMCIVPVPSSVCIRVYMCKCVCACMCEWFACIYICVVCSVCIYICVHDVGDCVGMCVWCACMCNPSFALLALCGWAFNDSGVHFATLCKDVNKFVK